MPLPRIVRLVLPLLSLIVPGPDALAAPVRLDTGGAPVAAVLADLARAHGFAIEGQAPTGPAPARLEGELRQVVARLLRGTDHIIVGGGKAGIARVLLPAPGVGAPGGGIPGIGAGLPPAPSAMPVPPLPAHLFPATPGAALPDTRYQPMMRPTAPSPPPAGTAVDDP